jgi:hypothetical protein
MQALVSNLEQVKIRIQQHCLAANRGPNSVELLAVSKTKPISDILLAYEAGQRLFGENYVQEAVDKAKQLNVYPDIEWHFIGPIQSNKTKLLAEHMHWVQSLDRLKIAKRLDEHCQILQRTNPLNVCIQINIDREPQKAGIFAEDLMTFAQALQSYQHLRLRGLMAIPKIDAPAQSYQQLQQLFSKLKQKFPTVDTLSVGMSDDMATAIQYGSTMVRIGTAIFGRRK